jgi:hypothetical protein
LMPTTAVPASPSATLETPTIFPSTTPTSTSTSTFTPTPITPVPLTSGP